MTTPQGPYELNPIQGTTHQENFTDFRPQPGGHQTAFQMHMEQTAFKAEQAAKKDALTDAEQLLGGREPTTAFEVEMLRSRTPLVAPASAEEPGSEQPLQLELDLNQEVPEKSASVEKESKPGPSAPATPTPPSLPGPNPGQIKHSA